MLKPLIRGHVPVYLQAKQDRAEQIVNALAQVDLESLFDPEKAAGSHSTQEILALVGMGLAATYHVEPHELTADWIRAYEKHAPAYRRAYAYFCGRLVPTEFIPGHLLAFTDAGVQLFWLLRLLEQLQVTLSTLPRQGCTIAAARLEGRPFATFLTAEFEPVVSRVFETRARKAEQKLPKAKIADALHWFGLKLAADTPRSKVKATTFTLSWVWGDSKDQVQPAPKHPVDVLRQMGQQPFAALVGTPQRPPASGGSNPSRSFSSGSSGSSSSSSSPWSSSPSRLDDWR